MHPYLNKKSLKENLKKIREGKIRSKRQERRTAKDFGGFLRSGSGNSVSVKGKGDVISDDFLFEDKTTKYKSFSLKVEDLVKHENYAKCNDKVPVFKIEFYDNPLFASEWVVLPLEVFKNLIEKK